MEIILLTGTFLMFLIGFYIMGKIDHFLKTSHIQEDIREAEEGETALIMGCSTLADNLKKLLEEHKIEYQQIEESNEYNPSNPYQYLFAVSNNDFENIMVGIIAKKNLAICKIVALCNCLDNRKIYEQNNIPSLYGTGITGDVLFQVVYSGGGR